MATALSSDSRLGLKPGLRDGPDSEGVRNPTLLVTKGMRADLAPQDRRGAVLPRGPPLMLVGDSDVPFHTWLLSIV